jgi:hypothetical protein
MSSFMTTLDLRRLAASAHGNDISWDSYGFRLELEANVIVAYLKTLRNAIILWIRSESDSFQTGPYVSLFCIVLRSIVILSYETAD